MQDEETIREIFFKSDEQTYNNKNNIDNYNIPPCKLQNKNYIECYDKVMELHPNYPAIFSTYVRKFRERPKIFTTPTKMKSILKNINHRIILIILL